MASTQTGAPTGAQAAVVGPTIQDLTRAFNKVLSFINVRKFDGKIGIEASKWLEEFEDEADAKNLSAQERFDKFKTFLTNDAREWYKVKVENAAQPPTNYNELRTIFLEYHDPDNKEQYLEDRMDKYVQLPGQKVKNYITGKEARCIDFDKTMSPLNRIKKIKKGMLQSYKAGIDQYTHQITTVEELTTLALGVERSLSHVARDPESDLKRDEKIEKLTEIQTKTNENFETLLKTLSVRDKEYEERMRILDEKESSLRDERERMARERSRERLRNSRFPPENYRFSNSSRDHSRDRYNFETRSPSRELGYSRETSSPRDMSNHITNYNSRNRSLSRDRNNYYNSNHLRNNYNNERRFQSLGRYNEWEKSYKDREQRGCGENVLQQRNRSQSPNRNVSFELPRKIAESRDLYGNSKCFNCDRVGHHAVSCPYPRKPKSPAPNRRANLVSREADLSIDEPKNNLIFHTVEVNGIEIKACIDSGSEISLIDSKVAEFLNLPIKAPETNGIKAFNGSISNFEGEVRAYINFKHKNDNYCISQVMGAFKPFELLFLLGNDFNKKVGLNIDCKNNCVSFNPESKDIKTESYHLNSVHSTQTITLKPRLSYFIKVTSSNRKTNNYFTAVVKTPKDYFKKNLLLIRERQMDFNDGKSSVEIYNFNSHPVVLKQGTIIGEIIRIERREPLNPLTYINNSYKEALNSSPYQYYIGTDSKADIIVEEIIASIESENGDLKSNLLENMCTFCNELTHKSDDCPDMNLWCESPAFRAKKR